MITFLTICFVLGIFAGAFIILGALMAILQKLFLWVLGYFGIGIADSHSLVGAFITQS
ncbi:hypothetical protein SAMN05216584_11134 [Selenomonas sp. WCT3]|uniref:hypothetical protein n=1 Tax=Selenomonas sp. WCT3 TaxID=3158785 RepID=UPI000883FB34|nr:hypothetical protein SAMN05216584_11134 [Selenomonas ruminantium]